jgi:hypothetical protein
LTVTVRVRQKGRTRTVTLGSARFSVRAGASKRVTIRLGAAARRHVRRRQVAGRVSARLDPVTQSGAVTLRRA